ncbi:MAG: hypothetical protein WDN08_01440 [Rhizomicrobium sp.]
MPRAGHGDIDAGLRDIAARFAHYRFFVDAMRAGGGRVEIAVAGDATPGMESVFRDLGIVLIFRPPS